MNRFKGTLLTLLILSFTGILMGCPSSGSSNDIVINGSVSSGGGASPQAIGGASVLIYQAQTGAPILVTQVTTDSNGNFTAKVPVSASNTTSNPST